jgi:CRP-like cAMP-binding protein
MAELSSDAIRRLERKGEVRRGFDGISAGGDAAPVSIVLAGSVKVYRHYPSCKQSLVHIAGSGDVVNVEPVLTGDSSPTHTVLSAGRRTHVLVVPQSNFRDLITSCDEIRSAVTRTLAQRVQEQETLLGYGRCERDVRVWTFLVGLAHRHSKRYGASAFLELDLRQSDIAGALGMSPKSVELALRALRRAGKLWFSGRWMSLRELPPDMAPRRHD